MTSTYFHEKSKSATPSEQYGEWGNSINSSSLRIKICHPPLNNMVNGVVTSIYLLKGRISISDKIYPLHGCHTSSTSEMVMYKERNTYTYIIYYIYYIYIYIYVYIYIIYIYISYIIYHILNIIYYISYIIYYILYIIYYILYIIYYIFISYMIYCSTIYIYILILINIYIYIYLNIVIYIFMKSTYLCIYIYTSLPQH